MYVYSHRRLRGRFLFCCGKISKQIKAKKKVYTLYFSGVIRTSASTLYLFCTRIWFSLVYISLILFKLCPKIHPTSPPPQPPAGYLSRYSDWLQTGRSGDRIPGGRGRRDFTHLTRPALGPIQPPV
jgi:hypothetical protein